MSRFLKKYSHKYEFLKLELEDFEEEYSKYETEWKKLFGKYFSQIQTEYWVNEETGEMRSTPPDEVEIKKDEKNTKVKKLYRKASTIAHPDKGGDIEEFNLVKGYYENNDLLGLVSYAAQKDINFEIDEDDKTILDQNCKRLETKIKNLRSSLIWNFFTGNDRMKKGVIVQLELDHGIKIDSKEILEQLENSK